MKKNSVLLIILLFLFNTATASMFRYREAFKQKDYKTAVEVLKSEVQKNNPSAIYYLGLAYKNGHGVKVDYKKAVFWFKKAVDLRHWRAVYMLGLMNYLGQGLVKNYQKAYQLLDKASFFGPKESYLTLAAIFRKGGYGIKKDEEKFRQYINKALRYRVLGAYTELGRLYYNNGSKLKKILTALLQWSRRMQ